MDITVQDKLSALALISQKKLLEILDKIPGRKDFIIDPQLIKPLERIVGVSKLKWVCIGFNIIYTVIYVSFKSS